MRYVNCLKVCVTGACMLVLSACVSSPSRPYDTPGPIDRINAQGVIAAARTAHGVQSYEALHDINVSYAGDWSWLVTKLQPVLTDANFRGNSQERLLPAERIVAQRHTGLGGAKQVVRTGPQIIGQSALQQPQFSTGDIAVSYNTVPSRDAEVLDAAAMVVDGYSFFLLGPLALTSADTRFRYVLADAIDGRDYDVLTTSTSPGLGRSQGDTLTFWFDRETHLMRRVRFSLNGMESTQGAVAEVEVSDYVLYAGVQWPTRFVERLIKPVPGLTVHHWRLTGLDVNRGYGREALGVNGFSGAAAADASKLVTEQTAAPR